MTTFKILQISDTHLSGRLNHFQTNNELMLEVMKGCTHDLIVHTGDITMDGIRYAEDFEFCHEFYDGLERKVFFLPGNHDVGDNPQLARSARENGSAIDEERMQRYLQFYQSDRWSVDRGSWRLLGINSLLIGSGLARERQQNAWVADQLADIGDRHLALFTHQPLFVDEPDPIELTYWTVDPQGRESLRFLMEHPNLRLIASGHLHQQRSRIHNRINLEWCPSIAFTTRERLVPEMGGQRKVGYLEHVFAENGSVSTTTLRHPRLQDHHLDDVIEVVYPFA